MPLCPAVCPGTITRSLGEEEMVWQGREHAVGSESYLTSKDLEAPGA